MPCTHENYSPPSLSLPTQHSIYARMTVRCVLQNNQKPSIPKVYVCMCSMYVERASTADGGGAEVEEIHSDYSIDDDDDGGKTLSISRRQNMFSLWWYNSMCWASIWMQTFSLFVQWTWARKRFLGFAVPVAWDYCAAGLLGPVIISYISRRCRTWWKFRKRKCFWLRMRDGHKRIARRWKHLINLWWKECLHAIMIRQFFELVVTKWAFNSCSPHVNCWNVKKFPYCSRTCEGCCGVSRSSLSTKWCREYQRINLVSKMDSITNL